MNEQITQNKKRYFVWSLQYLLGVLFIVSALLKINDPLGLTYKIDEYFDVFECLSLKTLSFDLAIAMNILEFTLGIVLLTNFKFRFFRWILLGLLILFLFLTAFAFFSGKLKECGCLGNCIPLTAEFSFYKDIILLLVAFILFFYHKQMHTSLSNKSARLVFWLMISFSYLAQMIVYIIMPPWDCMPYQVATNIPEEIQRYLTSGGNRSEMIFFYKKDGQEISFSADNFPLDFDSTYQFIRREDKLIINDNTQKGIADFVLTRLNDKADISDSILTQDSVQLILVLNDIGWNQLFQKIEKDKIKFLDYPNNYIVSSNSKALETFFTINELPMHQAILVDNVMLKTMCRSPLSIFILKEGTIISKRGALFYASLYQ